MFVKVRYDSEILYLISKSRTHLIACVVVPGGDSDPRDEAEDQDDEAEDDEAGGGVAGGPVLSVQQGAHGGHAEVLVTSLQ